MLVFCIVYGRSSSTKRETNENFCLVPKIVVQRGRMQEADLETLEKVCLWSEGAELDDSK